jgi:hypothetical protein
MYKEVNLSLIRWPVAASATMLAMSWIPMDNDWDNDWYKGQRHGAPNSTVSPDLAVVLELDVKSIHSAPVVLSSGAENESVSAVLNIAEERGSAALKLPSRVAQMLDATEGDNKAVAESKNRTDEKKAVVTAAKAVIKAPVRMVEQELAGLDITDIASNPAGHSSVITPQEFTSEPTAAELVILEQCESGRPSWMINPWSAEFWQPDDELERLVEEKSVSILPASNRVLGRRELMRSELQDEMIGASWAGATHAVRSHLQAVQKTCHGWLVRLARQSEKLKEFAAEHKLELNLQAESAGVSKDAGMVAAVVPVAGVLSADDEIVAKQVQQSVSRKVTDTPIVSVDLIGGWPDAKQLVKQLKQLAEKSEASGSAQGYRFISVDGNELTIAGWASRVQGLLADLRALPRLGDAGAREIILGLNGLAAEGRAQAESLEDRQQQIQWLRATYAISRRTAVWMPIWNLTQSDDASWDLVHEVPKPTLRFAVQQVRDDLVATGDSAGWSGFLMLDKVLEQGQSGTPASRAILSQRLMSRLEWHSLASEQSQWLQRESIEQLIAVIRPWAHTVVDYATLMNQLEQQESNAIDLAAVDIASATQTLRFANSPAAVRVANEINTHYRNANVRFAISERFIERMIPAIESVAMPVNTQVMGARVSGVSHVKSELDIDLEPSADRWSLKLNANGSVETDSVGRQGVVSVRTAATARFNAASYIEVTKRGLYLGDADAKVRSKTRLRGVDTAYDGWPLVGMLVRSIAEDHYQGMAPQANRIASREAEVRIESEINEQLETRVDEAALKVSEMVLGPLGRLQLDPRVTDMQTTEERLLARYRVAGDWQLGAFTPRPRALSDSLMSVQLHQSALNNTLEQLIPSDQAISIHDLIGKSAATFGKADVGIPDDIPADVMVQFARTRPITIEIEDGMLWLTLRVIRLRRDEGIDLTQFIVRAGYRAEVDGMNARLVRDGHLRISGPRMAMRERLPIRAIFNKIFAASREIPLTVPRLIENPAAQGLVVSQLELRDGWLALAISEEGAARIALRQE